MERSKTDKATHNPLTVEQSTERNNGRDDESPTDAAQQEREAFGAAAATYDEQEMARRGEQLLNGEGARSSTPETGLTDDLTGETREPSVLEVGLEAGAGERTRYAQDKAAERLTKQRRTAKQA